MNDAFYLYIIYKIIMKLITPFEKMDAYKLGIIDANGNVLKKRKDLKTQNEKQAYTLFDTFIINLKKSIGIIPGGKTKLGTYAAALFLLKESENMNHKKIQSIVNKIKMLNEDDGGETTNVDVETPTNSTAAIAKYETPMFNSVIKRKTFNNKVVFQVSPNNYHNILRAKSPYHKFSKYINDNDTTLQEIREYAKNNPSQSIIIQNENTGGMRYLKYGSSETHNHSHYR